MSLAEPTQLAVLNGEIPIDEVPNLLDQLIEDRLATQPEAEAGEINDKFMTPLRVAQAISAQVIADEIVPFANQAEAEGGSENTKVMTALRTAQQIDARVANESQAEVGTDDTVLMTPERVAQAIGEQAIYDLKATAEAATIQPQKKVTFLGGVTTSGLGTARYKRVDAEPSHELKFRSTDRYLPDGSTDNSDGGWWEIAEPNVTPCMAGAIGDGATDDLAALENLRDYVISLGLGNYVVNGEGKTYALSDTFTFTDTTDDTIWSFMSFVPIGVEADWVDSDTDRLAYWKRNQTYGSSFVFQKPLIKIEGSNTEFKLHNVNVDGNRVSAGIHITGNNRRQMEHVRVERGRTYGIFIQGVMHMINVQVKGNTSATDTRDAYGIAFDDVDSHWIKVTSQWSWCPLLVTGNTLFCTDCDLFNGSGDVPVNPKLVEFKGRPGASTWVGGRLGNGYSTMWTDGWCIQPSFVGLTSNSETSNYMVWRATEAAQTPQGFMFYPPYPPNELTGETSRWFSFRNALPFTATRADGSATLTSVSLGSEGYEVAIAAGGSGYTLHDILTVSGGTLVAGGRATMARVTAVDGSGAVTEIELDNEGEAYTSTPANPASTTGGSGTGCTLTVSYRTIMASRLLGTVGGQEGQAISGTGIPVGALVGEIDTIAATITMVDDNGDPVTATGNGSITVTPTGAWDTDLSSINETQISHPMIVPRGLEVIRVNTDEDVSMWATHGTRPNSFLAFRASSAKEPRIGLKSDKLEFGFSSNHVEIDEDTATINFTSLNPTGNIASGTYTPTITSVTNLDSSARVGDAQYMRVGSVVTVSGRLTLDPTAAAATEVGISLPVASNFANVEECCGAASSTAVQQAGAVVADPTNNRAALVYLANDTASRNWSYTFTYRII